MGLQAERKVRMILACCAGKDSTAIAAVRDCSMWVLRDTCGSSVRAR